VVRKFLYSFGLLLYILFSSAFVQPIEFNESLNISEASKDSKGKKKKKKKRRLRR
tara:strand:+ start:164 stop:328 length:165 start_codon:yes stop_codon:yes gene_type:complete